MMYGSVTDSSRETPLLDPLQSRRKETQRHRRQQSRLVLKTPKPILQTLFDTSKSSPSKRNLTTDEQSPPLTPHHHHHHHRHSFLYRLLSPYSKESAARIYKGFISGIILVDLVSFILSTDARFNQAEPFFHSMEGIASTVFLIEYMARLVVVGESKRYSSRLWYALTPAAMIDLLACLPFFLEIPTGINLPTLTYLRFFRLFRILKSEGSIQALDAVYRVVYYNREILYVAAMVCGMMVLVTAFLLYYLRPRDDEGTEFSSIAATLYLSTLLLTGQGGPSSSDLPWYTKAVVLLTSIFSVAMFAIPASMLTWGFEAEAARMAKRARRKQQRERNSTTSSSFCSHTSSEEDSDYSTDEEYFKIIAGDGGDDDDHGEDPGMKELRKNFKDADVNRDGALTMAEFVRSMQDGAAASVSDSRQLTRRVELLERQVRMTSDKLDQILNLLQQGKGVLT